MDKYEEVTVMNVFGKKETSSTTTVITNSTRGYGSPPPQPAAQKILEYTRETEVGTKNNVRKKTKTQLGVWGKTGIQSKETKTGGFVELIRTVLSPKK